MSSRSLVLASVVSLALCGAAHAAVDCTVREPNLPHKCKGGSNDGVACTPVVPDTQPDSLICKVARPAANDGCPGGVCEIQFVQGAKISGLMTLIVDENVSQFDGQQQTQNVVAVTVLLDLGKSGILAQTYQTLDGTLAGLTNAPTDPFGVPLSENLLGVETQDYDFTNKAKIINDLVFRGTDTEMADALRQKLGVASGEPAVTKVGSVRYEDQRASGLGSVLRMKVKGLFVEP
jgi:hypothetical protein